MKKAIVTGVTGQDGSYLAELLLSKGYYVIGCHRRSSTNNTHRLKNVLQHKNFKMEEFDLTDPSGCNHVVNKYQPDELYNLAAQSHVGTSFKQPTTTFEIDTVGVINLLESVRNCSPETRFYQASTSEMYGKNYDTKVFLDKGSKHYKKELNYQDEKTEMLPQSPYGVAKLASHRMVQIYREAYGIYTSSGILFNHESPRRGENFVTKKITKWIGDFVKWRENNTVGFRDDEIYMSKNPDFVFPKLRLGNLEAHRDWGYAGDYVEAMWLMLQQDNGDDYVICTGETHTIREFLDIAFKHVDIENWTDYVVQDPEFYRPAEVDYLLGLNKKARFYLDWYPKTSFKELVAKMVEYDTGYNNV